ncbi:MAG: DUF4426 domain-containing protein [Steroidobacter sp.]
MKTRTWILGAAFAIAAMLAGCDNPAQQAAAPAQPIDETFQEFGDYEVHYNALRTDALTPEVARAYGIQRSANRVMLNVAILYKEADHAPRKPVDGDVKVDAYNLNGQLKNLEMRRVSEGEAIYYIGEVSIGGTEILVFDISVTPSGASEPLRVKFKREFYSN